MPSAHQFIEPRDKRDPYCADPRCGLPHGNAVHGIGHRPDILLGEIAGAGWNIHVLHNPTLEEDLRWYVMATKKLKPATLEEAAATISTRNRLDHDGRGESLGTAVRDVYAKVFPEGGTHDRQPGRS